MLPLPPPKLVNAAPLDNAISFAFAVIPVPPTTFKVAAPEAAPPVNPLPAITSVMSPEPEPKFCATI